jgi:hypothetical protein
MEGRPLGSRRIWLDSYFFGRFFKQSPPAHVARYSMTVTNLGGTLMGISSIGFGMAIDSLGFGGGSVAFVVASVLHGAPHTPRCGCSGSRWAPRPSSGPNRAVSPFDLPNGSIEPPGVRRRRPPVKSHRS